MLTKEFGIKDIQGRPYHPQTRGQVERKNQTIKKAVSIIGFFSVFLNTL